MKNLRRYWYVAAESHELTSTKPLAREILGEWVVLFRDSTGQPVALQDRCLHRGVQLSKGAVVHGNLRCSYHGWTYDNSGRAIHVPSEGPMDLSRSSEKSKNRCAVRYDAIEKDDFIYVRLDREESETKAFDMPCYRKKGYTTIRLQNAFKNNITNCAENFVDIPHTTFVHPGIFRNPSGEKLTASVERKDASVKVIYQGERKNFGLFSWFLNAKGAPIEHTDEFFAPNVTSVNYWFGDGKHFIITSQSIPRKDKDTLVYTDLTYNYGIWNWLSRPIVRWQGQKIIDQDVEILGWQQDCLDRFGQKFQNSAADIIHTYIESLQFEIDAGRDPKDLPPRKSEIEFWI